jgi:hypothetical protein
VSIAIGAIGEVIVAIRGADGPGEVQMKVNGTMESYIAESVEPISRGQTVLVIAVGRHRHVTVVPWTNLQVSMYR